MPNQWKQSYPLSMSTQTQAQLSMSKQTQVSLHILFSLSHNLLSVSSGLDMDENASYLLVHPSIGTRKLVALPRKEDGGEDGF